MSRRGLRVLAILGMLAGPPLAAQEVAAQETGDAPAEDNVLEAQSGEPPESIDLLIRPEHLEENYEDCTDDQEAAIISGEIIVCRRKSEQEDRLYSNEEAQDRHAERTKGRMPMDVNVKNDIPMVGAGVTIRGCFIPPCPKPPVYMVDFDQLPETPKGSDAERVAQGLAPRGRQVTPQGATVIAAEPRRQANAEELGLPEPLGEAGEVSPSGSASQAE